MTDAELLAHFTRENQNLQNNLFKHVGGLIEGQSIRISAQLDNKIDQKFDDMEESIIGPIKEDIKTIKKETYVVRIAHRKPGRAILLIIIFIGLVAMGSSYVNAKRTLKNTTGIELNETPRPE